MDPIRISVFAHLACDSGEGILKKRDCLIIDNFLRQSIVNVSHAENRTTEKS